MRRTLGMYAVWLIAPVEDSLDKRIFCVSVLSYAEGEARFVVTQLNPQTGKYATSLDSAILHVVEYLVVLSFLTAQSSTEAVRQLTQSVVGKLKSTRVETIGAVEPTAKKVVHRELSYIGGSKQTDEGLVLSCSHNSFVFRVSKKKSPRFKREDHSGLSHSLQLHGDRVRKRGISLLLLPFVGYAAREILALLLLYHLYYRLLADAVSVLH